MITKGIRGAITVENNTSADIKDATLELIGELINRNNIKKEYISHVIFTLTKDLTAEFPAKYARTELGWNDVAMMCYNEADTDNSLPKCIRIMIVFNCDENFIPQYVYLKNAQKLRN